MCGVLFFFFGVVLFSFCASLDITVFFVCLWSVCRSFSLHCCMTPGFKGSLS